MELRNKIAQIINNIKYGHFNIFTTADEIIDLFSKWISVDDKLPIDYWKEEFGEEEVSCLIGTFIVCFDDEEDPTVSFAQYSTREGWCYPTGEPHDYWKDKITHWQTLPQLPRVKK